MSRVESEMGVDKYHEPPSGHRDLRPLDGLRGLCAFAIFVGHQLEIVAPAVKGQSVLLGVEYCQAVTLFFLLSGIPLTRLYTRTGKVDTWQGTWEFWWKRFARLGPIYYLTLCLNLAVFSSTYKDYSVWGTLESFAGCLFFVEAWSMAMTLTVAGALWQVAVFVYGYALFPFISPTLAKFSCTGLICGILVMWVVSAGLWASAFFFGFKGGMASEGQFLWWEWHFHLVSRLPQIVAGVFLGELLERTGTREVCAWGNVTDMLSVFFLFTGLQAPVVEWFYPGGVRWNMSIAFEAVLLPVHCVWLAGIVASYPQPCYTCKLLSSDTLRYWGEKSLSLYCLHLVVLFFYNSVYAYITTGSHYLAKDVYAGSYDPKPQWYHMPVQWALVLLVTLLSHKYFEKPSREAMVSWWAKKPGEVGASEGEKAPLVPPSV